MKSVPSQRNTKHARGLIPVTLAANLLLGGCATPQGTVQTAGAPIVYSTSRPGLQLAVYSNPFGSRPEAETDSRLQRFLYGPQNTASPVVRNPQGMTVHGDRLFICDQGLPDVVLIELSTGRMRRWTKLADRPACPVDVAVDDRGRVFVADTTHSGLLRYDPQGRLAGKLTPPMPAAQRFRPCSLEWDAGRLFVGDCATGRIHRYDTSADQWITPLETSEKAVAPGMPTGLAMSDGVLYIADALRGVVHRVDADGVWLASIGRQGRAEGELIRPMQIACTLDGLLFVADAGRQSIVVFDRDGQFVAEVGGEGGNPGGERFTLPGGLATLSSSATSHALARMHRETEIASDGVIVADLLNRQSLRMIAALQIHERP